MPHLSESPAAFAWTAQNTLSVVTFEHHIHLASVWQLEREDLAAIESFLGGLDAALAPLGLPVEALNAALENNLGPAEAARAATGNLTGPVDAALAAIKSNLGPSGAALASSPAGQRLEDLVAQAAGIAGLAGMHTPDTCTYLSLYLLDLCHLAACC